MDATTTPSGGEPPDATRNLIVALPPDMELNLNTDTPPTSTRLMAPNPKITPCCVKLTRCDISSPTPTKEQTVSHIEVNVVVKNPDHNPRSKIITSGNKATSTTRLRRSASRNISYAGLFGNSSSDDSAGDNMMQPVGAGSKREPSQYRLAAHKYMLASERGIISGPSVRTRANVVPKKDKRDREDSDSDATIILDPVPTKSKTRRRNINVKSERKQKTFVTKAYVLRKGGLHKRLKEQKEKTALI